MGYGDMGWLQPPGVTQPCKAWGPGTGDSGVLVLGTVGCWRWGQLDHWQWGYWTVGNGDTRVLALGTVECWYRGTWVLALVTLGSWH